MGLLKNLLKETVGDSISKGIEKAAKNVAEKVLTPIAEEYANKVAENLEEATDTVEEVKKEDNGLFSSLESSLNRIQNAAEKYADMLEGKIESIEDFEKEWNEKMTGFPIWCFSGKNFEIAEGTKTSDGNTFYYFYCEDAKESDLDLYCQILLENGFVDKYESSHSIMYKQVDDTYYVFSRVEAFEDAPLMRVGMFHTKDKSEFA